MSHQVEGAESFQPDPIGSLISRAVEGDRVALDTVLLHYHEPLLQYIGDLLHISKTPGVSAEDVLQETLISVFRNLGQFKSRGDGSFEAWLRSIAKSRLSNIIKAANTLKRGRRRRQENKALKDDAATTILSLVAGLGPSPSRITRQKEALKAMNDVIAGLSEEKRQVLELRFGQQLAVADVATALGKSEPAVKMMIHRVIKELRREMDLLGEFGVGE